MSARDSGYRRIHVRPIAGALGAEIDGVDLSQPMDAETRAEVHRAWLENLVVFFRGQDLDIAGMERVGRCFGDLTVTPHNMTEPGSDYVHRMIRDAAAVPGSRNYGDRWHTDQVVKERPIAGIVLHALDCPPFGGDTMFANLYLAYETLSDGMKAMCEALMLVHSPSGPFSSKPLTDQKGTKNIVNMTPEQLQEYLRRETAHPLVRIHPETGRRLLYTTGDFAIRFKDMTEAESRPLIDMLNRHASRPEFTCRFHWTKGAVALIDNRCCQHYAVNDYAGFRREMLRVEIDDKVRPYGPAAPLPADQAA